MHHVIRNLGLVLKTGNTHSLLPLSKQMHERKSSYSPEGAAETSTVQDANPCPFASTVIENIQSRRSPFASSVLFWFRPMDDCMLQFAMLGLECEISFSNISK